MQHTTFEETQVAISTWRNFALMDGAVLDDCPVRRVLDKLGEKWTMLVVLTLADEALRFNAIRRKIPDISQKMLTQTLRELQRHGLVNRQVFATVPPSVEYSLTEMGRSLLEPFGHLVVWANRHDEAIFTARSNFDAGIPI